MKRCVCVCVCVCVLSSPDCIRHGFHILVKLGLVVLSLFHCTISTWSDMSMHAAVMAILPLERTWLEPFQTWAMFTIIPDELAKARILYYYYYSFSNTITRSHSLSLVCNHSRINSFRYSFFIRSAFLWNSLPSDLVQSISYNSFKLKLKHYYLLHWNNSLFYSSLSLIFVLCSHYAVVVPCIFVFM